MNTTRTFRIALLSGAMGALLALPASGSAAVTIGETLDPSAPTAGIYCVTGDGPATFATTALPSGTPASPIDGVVVRWRFRNDESTAISLRPRVLRSGPGGFTGVSGGDQTASFVGLGVFEARLPIAAGDYLGVDFPCSSSAPHVSLTERYYAGGGATVGNWVPALADGGPFRATTFDDVKYSLMMNADVEPDADHDGYGDETQDACPGDAGTHESCPMVTPAPVTSTVPAADTTPPNASAAFKRTYRLRRALRRGIAGSVTSSEAGKVIATATIGSRTARRLGLRRSVRVASGDASIAAPGKVLLKLVFGSRARRKLAAATRIKLTVRLSATDSTGNVTAIVRTITLTR
jgi:hypothetical protein